MEEEQKQDSWKNLYFELKDLTKTYREWCNKLKEENLKLREELYILQNKKEY